MNMLFAFFLFIRGLVYEFIAWASEPVAAEPFGAIRLQRHVFQVSVLLQMSEERFFPQEYALIEAVSADDARGRAASRYAGQLNLRVRNPIEVEYFGRIDLP